MFPRWLVSERSASVGRTFFVTWRLRAHHRILAPAERDLVCQVLRHHHGQRYELKAYVVMDDHVHVLVRIADVPVGRVVHSWRALTAHELQRLHRRTGRIWQDGASTEAVATEEALRSRVEYIIGNPWKRWPFLKRYPWVWEADGLTPDAAIRV